MAKKIFRAEKIKADEICGITGNFVVDGNVIASGGYVHAQTYVSGATGYFGTLHADNFEQNQDLVYAFRFGGPPINVPSRLPVMTATGLRLTGCGPGQEALPANGHVPYWCDVSEDQSTWPVTFGFTGLASGHNLVFVEDPSSFPIGEHIIINPGGLYGDGIPQEEHTVIDSTYYWPTGCCNSQVSGYYNAGNDGILHTDTISRGYNFIKGDHVKISGSETVYTITQTGSSVTEGIRTLDFAPVLQENALDSGCICLVQPTLLLEDKLQNDYPTGTKIANVFPRTSTTVAKDSCLLNLDGHLDPWYSNADPYWDKTVLILQSTGAHGSIKFCDSSPVLHLVTGFGDVHQSNVQSKFGHSIYFDGNGDYLTIGEDSAGSLDLDANPFAIEFWFYTTGHNYIDPITLLPSSGTILSKGSVGTDLYEDFSVFYGSGEKIHVHGLNQANSGLAAVSTNTLALDTWHHIAIVREDATPNQMKLYVNGSEEAAWAKTNTVYNSTRPLYVGKNEYNLDQPTDYFKGYVEEVRITKGVPRYEDKDRFTTSNTFVVPTSRAAMPPFNKYVAANYGCINQICYNTQYLYLETFTGMGRWMATGYREWFVGESGIEVHITGAPHGTVIPNILTLSYPHNLPT